VEESPQRESGFRIPPCFRSFEELALEQGVAPILDFESLVGHPSPDDESAEEFSAALREWRRKTTLVPAPDERRNP
jgi:hypothetical protein